MIPPANLSVGVRIDHSTMAKQHAALSAVITKAAAVPNDAPGIVGAAGGAQVKLLSAGAHEILLPLPQLTPRHIPLRYAITSIPPDAATEYRIRERETNQVIGVTLQGERNQEIKIEWSATILITDDQMAPVAEAPAFLAASPCVQSDAQPVIELATTLWPDSGDSAEFAANIQAFIRDMKQAKQPSSLDALGILNSGGNWICTANANLAAALLRSKGIAARSLAVIPPNGRQLEMHRVVEYLEDSQWTRFDPSSLHLDIPMKPWQHIIMATTSVADEAVAMTPRMGTAPGCPYGHELEFLDNGATLLGQHFFWTIAKSLGPSDVDAESATAAWKRFLETGVAKE